MQRNAKEAWDNSDAYDRFMGRWSARVALPFLEWLNIPADMVWLDVGCGVGSLTKCILEIGQPREVIGIDTSVELIAHARQAVTDLGVRFQVGDAQALELETDSMDAAVSGIMLNFVPQPGVAVTEMIRVVKPGGAIGIYVWDYAEGMEMLRYFWDAAVALDPEAAAFDEGKRFPLCRRGALQSLVERAGLQHVEALPIEVSTVFRNFADFWTPFLGRVGPAPSYNMSLTEPNRQRLEDRLRKTLPIAADGSIALTARVWAVKGITV